MRHIEIDGEMDLTPLDDDELEMVGIFKDLGKKPEELEKIYLELLDNLLSDHGVEDMAFEANKQYPLDEIVKHAIKTRVFEQRNYHKTNNKENTFWEIIAIAAGDFFSGIDFYAEMTMKKGFVKAGATAAEKPLGGLEMDDWLIVEISVAFGIKVAFPLFEHGVFPTRKAAKAKLKTISKALKKSKDMYDDIDKASLPFRFHKKSGFDIKVMQFKDYIELQQEIVRENYKAIMNAPKPQASEDQLMILSLTDVGNVEKTLYEIDKLLTNAYNLWEKALHEDTKLWADKDGIRIQPPGGKISPQPIISNVAKAKELISKAVDELRIERKKHGWKDDSR